MPLLENVDIPVYLGCDWQNAAIAPSVDVHHVAAPDQQPGASGSGMLDEFGLTWPWESLHVEALAWFDHWLKRPRHRNPRRTAVRYAPAGSRRMANVADPGRPQASSTSWRCAPTARWPTTKARRAPVVHGSGRRPGAGQAQPASTRRPQLSWTSARWPRRSMSSATSSCGWWHRPPRSTQPGSSHCPDVAPDGTLEPVTAGWLRARCARSTKRPAGPAHPCCPAAEPAAVPIGEDVQYRIPLVPNARRFAAGHRIAVMHHQ